MGVLREHAPRRNFWWIPRNWLFLLSMKNCSHGATEDMSLDGCQCEDPVRLSADRLKALVDRIEGHAVCRECVLAILRDIAADLSSIA
jgi:hypothetical protein